MNVNLTKDEVKALYELGRYALRSRDAQADPDAQGLVSAMSKLRRIARTMVCAHCGERLASRKDRICDTCHNHRRKFGRLPNSRALTNRWQRRVSTNP